MMAGIVTADATRARPFTFEEIGASIDIAIQGNPVQLSSAELHDYLTQRGLLPARERVGLRAAP